MNGRIKQIDILNGIGIVFVVLGHYSTYMEYLSWSEWIWSWHMPLFFLSGGYLFALKEEEYFKRGYINFFKRRICNILLPYAVFYFISFVTGYILLPILKGQALKISDLELRKNLVAFLLGGGYLENVKINNFPLWFFTLYFIAQNIYYGFIKVKIYHNMIYMLLILFIVVITIPFQEIIPGRPAYHINVLPVALIFMAIGHLFYEKRNHLVNVVSIRWKDSAKEVIAGVCIMTGLFIAYRYPGNVGHIGSLTYIIGACCTVLGIYIYAGYDKGVYLAFLGKNSVIILGLHGLAGGVFRNYIEGRLMQRWDGPLMNFILVSLQIMLLSIISICYRKAKHSFHTVLYQKQK